MNESDEGVARRTVLRTASLGFGAGLVSGLTPAQAESVTPASGGDIWSSE